MPDYSKASNKHKPVETEGEKPSPPEKQIPKVVEGEVTIRKKGIGRKFKDLVVSADLKGVAVFLVLNKVIPGIRNLAYEAWVEGGSRVMFPGTAARRPFIDTRGMVQRSVFNYQSPISRSTTIPLGNPRTAPPREIGPRASAHPAVVQNSRPGEQYVFSSKEDAFRVLEILREALAKYEEPVSVADLYEAAGIQSVNGHVDNKWGWNDLADVKLLQSPQGYLLDFPPSQPIT